VHHYIVGYYDTFLIYAKTIKNMIEDGEDIFDGRMVTNRIWNKTFKGLISGDRKINENGDGEIDLSLHDFDAEGKLFVKISLSHHFFSFIFKLH
jgi:hypothetical protein